MELEKRNIVDEYANKDMIPYYVDSLVYRLCNNSVLEGHESKVKELLLYDEFSEDGVVYKLNLNYFEKIIRAYNMLKMYEDMCYDLTPKITFSSDFHIKSNPENLEYLKNKLSIMALQDVGADIIDSIRNRIIKLINKNNRSKTCYFFINSLSFLCTDISFFHKTFFFPDNVYIRYYPF